MMTYYTIRSYYDILSLFTIVVDYSAHTNKCSSVMHLLKVQTCHCFLCSNMSLVWRSISHYFLHLLHDTQAMYKAYGSYTMVVVVRQQSIQHC